MPLLPTLPPVHTGLMGPVKPDHAAAKADESLTATCGPDRAYYQAKPNEIRLPAFS